jgi:hypothetical protein
LATLILDDHVMHDDTSGHDMSNDILILNLANPLTIVNWACKILNALSIFFPSHRSCIMKLESFLSFWIFKWLHNCLSP